MSTKLIWNLREGRRGRRVVVTKAPAVSIETESTVKPDPINGVEVITDAIVRHKMVVPESYDVERAHETAVRAVAREVYGDIEDELQSVLSEVYSVSLFSDEGRRVRDAVQRAIELCQGL